jgi:glycosyltransferase involved in cell wall biosynthesis
VYQPRRHTAFAMPLTGIDHVPANRRIGLVYRSGRPHEEAWSRIPAGFSRGLNDLGLDSCFIDAEPKNAVTRISKIWTTTVRRNRRGGMFTPEIRELRRMTARLRAARLGRFDAIIQMGSDFGVPFPRRMVTYEDTTVVQRTRVDALDVALGAEAIERWVNAQMKCYATAIGCCTMSQSAADSIVADYRVDPRKVHVVWAGRNCDPRPIVRDWSQPRFFFMGYDWERKNGPLLLEAFARLKARVPNARLDIAGGHPRLDVEGVTPHGSLDLANARDKAHAEALFESATCFIMPSQFEPFGIVYVEAAAAGVPSIGTVAGGARDAIGKGGLLVEPCDEEALIEAMAVMCNPSRAAAMGAAALERSNLFTWTAVAERIARVLELPSRPSGGQANRFGNHDDSK